MWKSYWSAAVLGDTAAEAIAVDVDTARAVITAAVAAAVVLVIAADVDTAAKKWITYKVCSHGDVVMPNEFFSVVIVVVTAAVTTESVVGRCRPMRRSRSPALD